jgi:opacity protein-like surface antigen
MKSLKYFVLPVLFLITWNYLSAQKEWSAELRPGINFSTQDLCDAELKTGFGFEASVSYRFMPHLGVYVGWGWNQFTSDNASLSGTGESAFEETGYTFGLQFIHPINNSHISYLLRAGGIYNHIEVENNAGNSIADSAHSPGWEIGGGLNIDLGSNWNLRPQIGYRSLSSDIEMGNTSTAVDLKYFVTGVGIALLF